MVTEEKFRSAIVWEALSWRGTPYRSSGTLKGVGCNCAQFLFGVAINSGAIPKDSPKPLHYSPQFSLNKKEERLLAVIDSYGASPIEEREVKPGDIVVYKNGLSHGHAAIVIKWPDRIIHVLAPSGCQEAHGLGGILGKMPRKFRTLWHGNIL
jgi:cell wall-associated NlpC family hydrolase